MEEMKTGMGLWSKLLGVVFVFLVGILSGIALDWATWLAPSRTQRTKLVSTKGPPPTPDTEYYFLAGDNGKANLVVYPGEVLKLLRADSGTMSAMRFSLTSPCTPTTGDNTSSCTISTSAVRDSPYTFTCFAKDATAYGCSDPGIQVRSSPPVEFILGTVGFWTDLDSVAHYAVTGKRLPLQIVSAPTNP